MKKIFLIILTTGIISLAGQTFAQPIASFESRSQQLEEELNARDEQIATLQLNLDQQLDRIDLIKSAREVDDGALRRAMREAKIISDKIEELREERAGISRQLFRSRNHLRQAYSAGIDSLVEAGRDLSDPQLNEFFYRRLELTPDLKPFSFQPQQISRANIHAQDSLERDMAASYLSLALTEIDTNLIILNDLMTDLDEQLRFARKTERFLDDMSDGPGLGIATGRYSGQTDQTRSGQTTRSTELYNSDLDKNLNTIILQISPYLSTVGENIPDPPAGMENLEDFYNLVKTSRQYLILYRKQISDKLNH